MALKTLHLCCLLLTVLSTICIQEVKAIDLSLGFIHEPTDAIAERNHPFMLNCSAYSGTEYGNVTITWRHQGIDIKENRLRILRNGSLYFPRIVHQRKTGESDSGLYQCVATNSVGTLVSHNISLTIANISRKFVENPVSQSVEEDDVVRLTCQIMATPPPIYTWQKNRKDLPHNDRRISTNNSGILLINGVKKTDAGKYRCSVSNFSVRRYSQEATLEVTSGSDVYRAPKILTPSYNVTAKVDTEILLECAVSGYPKPVVTWHFSGKNNNSRIQTAGQGSLFFTKVERSNSGEYTCNASNQNPETKETKYSTITIVLKVFTPPDLIKRPQSLIVPVVKTARFECEVGGYPPPQVLWWKDGQLVLPKNGRIKLKKSNNIYALTLMMPNSNTSGIYQCVAQNEVGTSIASARLQINISEDQPDPPTDLRARTVSSTTIFLKWTPPKIRNGLQIQAYTVHYAPASGGDELSLVAVNPNCTLHPLKPFTNFSFYIRAYNGKSASDESEILIWSTGEDVPIAAPALTLSSSSPTTLHVSWEELPIDSARGKIINYKVIWRQRNYPTPETVEVPGDIREYTITGLRAGGKYEVRVNPKTKMGYPNLSDSEWPWVRHEMSSQNSMLTSLNLDLTAINSTAILVKWKCSEHDKCAEHVIEGFKIRYRKQNHRLEGPIKIPQNLTHFLLSKLVPDTWYEIHILAYNNNGDGVESVGNILTLHENHTVEDSPNVEPPSSLEAAPTSSTSIAVSWKDPISSRNISYFTVRFNPVPSSNIGNASSVSYLRSTGKEVIITDLVPFTSYEFSVCSHDQNNKRGPYSNPVVCKTGEDVPTAPTELHWKALDHHSVIIMWQPPEFPNGLIVNYYILYNTENSAHCNLENWIMKEEEGTSLSTEINGLASNTYYYVCLRAKTRIGTGPPTDVITLNIYSPGNKSTLPPIVEEFQDPRIGIIVGISIGLGCMVICALVIVIRNRALASHMEPHHGYVHHYHLNGNGHMFHAHCNGHSDSEHRFSSDSHELESFVPMLSQVNENASPHLDTKHKSWEMKNGYHYSDVLEDKMSSLQPNFLLSNSELDDDIISISERSQNEDSGVQLAPSQETESFNQDCCSLQCSGSEQSSCAATAESGTILPQNDDSSHSCLWDSSLQPKDKTQAHQPS